MVLTDRERASIAVQVQELRGLVDELAETAWRQLDRVAEAIATTYSDAHLATVWHLVQANPADGFADQGPGEAAEKAGREIIRRWLRSVDPELWHHQGRHYYWQQLRQFGHWDIGVFVPDAHAPATPKGDHAEPGDGGDNGDR